MADYWKERFAKSQDKLSQKNIKQVEKQLKKYYGRAAQSVIREFEATLNKLYSTIEAGKEPTPADLYKLDKYWMLQGQMRRELNRLGERQITTLTKLFEINFFDVYWSIGKQGSNNFTTLNTNIVHQLINQIWCADGKTWSARIWENIALLQETLNEGLLDCVISGKKTTELKNILQERFNVSYSRADSLVRTEMANIQTQAAKKRYQDYGIQEVEVWVDEDERTCPICAEHEGERYSVHDKMPVPFHPRCRCCMVPVVEVE